MITIVVRDCFIAGKLNDNYCCERLFYNKQVE